ncbi:hypothetical protein V6L77_06665 [Pannonibacter sp. Pt2-lr]
MVAQQIKDSSQLSHFLPQVTPASLVEGADAFGPVRPDLAAAPVLRGEKRSPMLSSPPTLPARRAIPASPST